MIEDCNIISIVLHTQILKQSVLKPASSRIPLNVQGSGSVILLRPKMGLAPQNIISMPRQQYTNNIVAAFWGMHVSLWNIAMRDYQESVTTGQTHRRTVGQTDAIQSDPYVPLCFAGDTTKHIPMKRYHPVVPLCWDIWAKKNIQWKFVLPRSENRQNFGGWLTVLFSQMRQTSVLIVTISGVSEWSTFPSPKNIKVI